MKRADIILIGTIVLVVAAIFFVVSVLGGSRSADYVRISVDGREFKRVSLHEPQTVDVNVGERSNRVKIDSDGSIYMAQANCDNQDCVHQGAITKENAQTRVLGNMIVCLPNRVVIELVAEDVGR